MDAKTYFEKIKEYKLLAKKEVGQNFLIDYSLAEKIVDSLGIIVSDTKENMTEIRKAIKKICIIHFLFFFCFSFNLSALFLSSCFNAAISSFSFLIYSPTKKEPLLLTTNINGN